MYGLLTEVNKDLFSFHILKEGKKIIIVGCLQNIFKILKLVLSIIIPYSMLVCTPSKVCVLQINHIQLCSLQIQCDTCLQSHYEFGSFTHLIENLQIWFSLNLAHFCYSSRISISTASRLIFLFSTKSIYRYI